MLIVIVGVYLAYNANNGLPFVPTYDLNAELPNGAKLVAGNDVRLGGFRVGVIDEIKPALVSVKGQSRAVALVKMKLDKDVEPLARDTTVSVRMRSALGLKYIQLNPGRAPKSFRQGDTIPLTQLKAPVEYEDVFSTFDKRTRDNSRSALKGFGDAFAGRGASINEAIAAFNPFFRHLSPVMKTLSAPATRLRDFFKNIGQAAAQAAPVAATQARVFGEMARTFDAFKACPRCLQQTIERSPPTLQAAIQSFQVQRPFLTQFTILSRKLRPVAQTLHQHLPTINTALEAGIRVLPRTVTLNRLTGQVFQALDYLANQPQTLLALKDLHTTFLVARPLLEYVAPYQTVCNDAVAWFTGLSGHLAMGVTNGTSENIQVKTGSNRQPTTFNAMAGRRADLPSDYDPQASFDEAGNHYQVLHGPPYPVAVDAQGNADCQGGQVGYVAGPLDPVDKFQPVPISAAGGDLQRWFNEFAGGSHVAYSNDTPGLEGGTYVTRRLGINNVRDVP